MRTLGSTVDFLRIHLGDGLEVDSVAAEGEIFLFVFLDDLVNAVFCVFDRKFAAVCVPKPRIAPYELDIKAVSVLDHLARVKRRKIVPYNNGVHLELDHIVDKRAVVVDDVSPSPDAAALYFGI